MAENLDTQETTRIFYVNVDNLDELRDIVQRMEKVQELTAKSQKYIRRDTRMNLIFSSIVFITVFVNAILYFTH